MKLQAVAILGGIVTVCTPVLVDGGVGFHVGVEHGLVDTGVAAMVAPERFGSKMVAQMVLQMMLVFSHKRTFGAGEKFLRFDVSLAVLPEVLLGDSDKLALLALERFDFALRINPRYSYSLFIFQLLWSQVVFILEVGSVVCLHLGHEVTLDAPELVMIIDVIIELVT